MAANMCWAEHLAVPQAHDLLDVLDLLVLRDLRRAGLPRIQQLAPAGGPHSQGELCYGQALP